MESTGTDRLGGERGVGDIARGSMIAQTFATGGLKLQVTLGRAFIMGFGFMLGVGVAALVPGLVVLIVVAAAAGGG